MLKKSAFVGKRILTLKYARYKVKKIICSSLIYEQPNS